LIRFRIYAFDGEAFRTMWAPDDMFNAEVAIRDRGFEIRHTLRSDPAWPSVRDEYDLTADGPIS
jgi:hypothetical protein